MGSGEWRMEGRVKPLFCCLRKADAKCPGPEYLFAIMIKKQKVQALVEAFLAEREGLGLFLVSVSVSPKNEIKVYMDGMQGVDIDDCVEMSRYIEGHLDREEEDFELTVSSAGLDQPLRVPAQYKKNEGREAKVVTAGGETLKGVIESAGEEGFSLRILPARKKSGKKDEEQEAALRSLAYADVKETKLIISFK